MSTISQLLPRVEAYCEAHKIKESTFGRLAVNDGKLLPRLREGGSITLDTLERIETALTKSPSELGRPSASVAA